MNLMKMDIFKNVINSNNIINNNNKVDYTKINY